MWRLFTCFFFWGRLSFQFLINMMLLYRHSSSLETSIYDGRKADYVFFLLFSAAFLLLSTALLHGDWMHVIVNSLMLFAFGRPVARTFGKGPTAWGLWMIVFSGSIIAGSVLYLAIATVDSPWVVGASGGTSGLVAAAGLLDSYGMKGKLWSRKFLAFTATFAAFNIVLIFLTFAAPYALGMGIAWEAHVGGYIAGAVLMSALPVKGYRVVQS